MRDEREGVWLKEFPAALLEAPYATMMGHLSAWADWLEQENIIGHRGCGEVRTHYRAILSFEAPVTTLQAKSMLALWMDEAFPKAQAAAFVHRNTEHLHVHVWIAARQTDGRKINLSARAFRQLDEQWNRIYAQVHEPGCARASAQERNHRMLQATPKRGKRKADRTARKGRASLEPVALQRA